MYWEASNTGAANATRIIHLHDIGHLTPAVRVTLCTMFLST